MKAYGLNRYDAGDTDATGSASGGRATRIYNVTKDSAYHSLRRGKKAAVRRRFKRAARAESKALCYCDD